jgi:hypothetical protein
MVNVWMHYTNKINMNWIACHPAQETRSAIYMFRHKKLAPAPHLLNAAPHFKKQSEGAGNRPCTDNYSSIHAQLTVRGSSISHEQA